MERKRGFDSFCTVHAIVQAHCLFGWRPQVPCPASSPTRSSSTKVCSRVPGVSSPFGGGGGVGHSDFAHPVLLAIKETQVASSPKRLKSPPPPYHPVSLPHFCALRGGHGPCMADGTPPPRQPCSRLDVRRARECWPTQQHSWGVDGRCDLDFAFHTHCDTLTFR